MRTGQVSPIVKSRPSIIPGNNPSVTSGVQYRRQLRQSIKYFWSEKDKKFILQQNSKIKPKSRNLFQKNNYVSKKTPVFAETPNNSYQNYSPDLSKGCLQSPIVPGDTFNLDISQLGDNLEETPINSLTPFNHSKNLKSHSNLVPRLEIDSSNGPKNTHPLPSSFSAQDYVEYEESIPASFSTFISSLPKKSGLSSRLSLTFYYFASFLTFTILLILGFFLMALDQTISGLVLLSAPFFSFAWMAVAMQTTKRSCKVRNYFQTHFKEIDLKARSRGWRLLDFDFYEVKKGEETNQQSHLLNCLKFRRTILVGYLELVSSGPKKSVIKTLPDPNRKLTRLHSNSSLLFSPIQKSSPLTSLKKTPKSTLWWKKAQRKPPTKKAFKIISPQKVSFQK